MRKFVKRILKVSTILVLIVILIAGCWIAHLYFSLPHRAVKADKDIGLSAQGHRIAAAFVLTRDHNPVGFSNTYTYILDLEGKSFEACVK